MQLGFYFDQMRCTGCQACAVACKDWKDVPAGSAALCRIVTLEEGHFPKPLLRFYPLMCFHCAEPPCVDACPTQAISKRSNDGVVVVEEDLCLPGCRRCREVCPYQAPQFLEDGSIRLCDLCLKRLEGGGQPVCVLVCPQRALDAGLLEDLRSRYGGEASVKDFPDPDQTRPSILFRRKEAQEISQPS